MPLLQHAPAVTRAPHVRTANIVPIARSKVGSAAFAGNRGSGRGSRVRDREYTCPTLGIKLNDWLSVSSLSPEKRELLMGKFLVAIAVFAVFPLLLAQQTLNNTESSIRHARLSEIGTYPKQLLKFRRSIAICAIRLGRAFLSG
jgi:hypothetical protein